MSSAERAKRRDESTILSRQLGLITQEQALAIGVSKPSITRRTTSGEWERSLPRVYRSTAVPTSFRQHALAAMLWAGESATLSHACAGALWRLDCATPEQIDLWLPSRATSPSPLVVTHSGNVDSIDRRLRTPVWLTSPARTLVDLAGDLSGEVLEAAVESAFRLGLTTPAAVARRIDVLGGKGRNGSARLRRLLVDRAGTPALEYRLEVKVSRLLRAAGLHPVRQYEVQHGGITRRLDFAFPACKVAVEANGLATHGGRLGTERDYKRMAWLVARGWRVVPVSWQRVGEDPDGFLADVRDALRIAVAA